MSFISRNSDSAPFWKDLLLVVLPAAVASIGPVVVSHYLSKNDSKQEENTSTKKAEG